MLPYASPAVKQSMPGLSFVVSKKHWPDTQAPLMQSYAPGRARPRISPHKRHMSRIRKLLTNAWGLVATAIPVGTATIVAASGHCRTKLRMDMKYAQFRGRITVCGAALFTWGQAGIGAGHAQVFGPGIGKTNATTTVAAKTVPIRIALGQVA